MGIHGEAIAFGHDDGACVIDPDNHSSGLHG